MERFKRTIILLTFAFMPLLTFAQKYSVDFNKAGIESVLKHLRQITDYDFVYQKQEVDRGQSITCSCQTNSLNQLLKEVLVDGAGLDFQIVGTTVVVKRGQPEVPEERHRVLKGQLVDENDYPLEFATIRVKGTKTGTTTDAEGRFSITVSGKATLEFSYIGFNTVTKTFSPGQNNVKVILHEDKSQLEEVVVTGYQILDKRSLTSAVTSVKMKDLQRSDVSSLDQMLEGKVPDLVVNNNSGEIGVAPKIRIRGTSSIVGNREPLWVVDGIVVNDPVEISPEELNDPDYVNRIGNAIAGINPQDIERIDVLKDAAATAIYGTKAANGVIVVTTKRGFEGKPEVSYNASLNFKLRPRYSDRQVDVMSSKERIQFSRELAQSGYTYDPYDTQVGYEKLTQQLYNKEINFDQFQAGVSQAESRNTDWFDLLMNDSWSQSHSVSLSGGSKQTRYYASVGYTKDNDVVKTNANERYTASIHLDTSFNKWFKASFSFNGYNTTRNYYQSSIAPVQYAYQTSRTIPAFTDDGEDYYYYKRKVDKYTEYNYNILNELANSGNKQEVTSGTMTANFQFTLTDWLRANAIFSYTHSSTDMESYWGDRTNYAAGLRGSEYGEAIKYPGESEMPQGGDFTKSTMNDRSYTGRLQLDANKYFGGEEQHNIDVTFGLEVNSDKYKQYVNETRGYYPDRGETFVTNIDPAIYTTYATWLSKNVPVITDNLTNEFSTYLAATYAYKDIWRINGNARVDGSNKFGDRSNEKFLPIWSISGSHNVGHWLKAKWVDYVTAKASFGFQGNMLSTETPVITIKKNPMDTYYNAYTAEVNTRPNPKLKWETTQSWNVGLDFSLFNGRLEGNLNGYYKKTKDAFMNKAVSTVNGVSSYVINGGDITNKGYSVDLTYTPIRNSDFRWTLSTSFSKIINTIDSRPSAQTYDLKDFLNGTAVVQGKSVNTFYSYRFLKLSPIDGGPMFDDYEDNQRLLSGLSKYDTYTTVLSASGKRDPDITGSFSTSIRWKQWRASASFSYNIGAKTRLFAMFGSAAGGGAYGATIYSEKNYSRDYMDRWQKPGDELTTNIPAIIPKGTDAYDRYQFHWSRDSRDDIQQIADNYWDMYDYADIRVVSADFLKMQSATLTYEFDYKQLKKLRLQRLALSLSAYNLFTICDPALKGQTPTQGGFSTIQLSDRPSFSFGMNIIF